MKRISIAALLLLAGISSANSTYGKAGLKNAKQRLYFIENNGQVTDQHHRRRTDVQYAVTDGGVTVFVGSGKLHYQFSKTSVVPQKPSSAPAPISDHNPAAGTVTVYRMDVELIGANPNAQVVAEEKQQYTEHFYLPGCGAQGIHASSFSRIRYRNIYPGIDWVIYAAGNKLEHEFIVSDKGNPADIRIRYSGQTGLHVAADGSLLAETPMGKVRENAPVCYNAAGKIIPSAYKQNGDVITYQLPDVKGPLVIDPLLDWATYYGPDSSSSPLYGVACDTAADVYVAGLTWSSATGSIATSGIHQEVFAGLTDAYLVKFDSAGNRIWATYYGGSNGDWATAVACSREGDVYVGGVAFSPDGISTAGSQQPIYGGGPRDGFLAKFNKDGFRQWGTYVGGTGANTPSSVSCDTNGHVYIAGESNDATNIATPGTHQPTKAGGWDAFLVQYDYDGVRQWGTYYGGLGDEFGGIHANDGQYVYMAALTPSTTNIATPFAYSATFNGGGSDAFVAKLDVLGARLWGTYYGGSGTENIGGLTCDKSGRIYLLGTTNSETNIASAGAYQTTNAGGVADAFLVKFDPELGFRIWGTYFGGPLEEITASSRITTDDTNQAYIAGITSSTSGIATPDGWQTTFGGGDLDGFVAKFSESGARKWSSFYGGEANDEARAVAWDGWAFYVAGVTTSSVNIATPDGFIPAGGGSPSAFQGFLAKFGDPLPPPIDTPDTETAVYSIQQAELASVFPNPVTGIFTVEGKVSLPDGSAEITVSDITGSVLLRDVATVRNGRVSKQLSSATIAPGIYFVKIVCGNKLTVLKLQKE